MGCADVTVGCVPGRRLLHRPAGGEKGPHRRDRGANRPTLTKIVRKYIWNRNKQGLNPEVRGRASKRPHRRSTFQRKAT